MRIIITIFFFYLLNPVNGQVYHFDFNHSLTENIGGGKLQTANNVEYLKDHWGVDCGSLQFNGTNFLILPLKNFALDGLQSFSLATWVKADKTDSFDDLVWFTILCKGNETKEKANSPHLRFQVTSETVSLSTENTWKKINFFIPNVWYHLAVTCNGKNVVFYVNGKENAHFELVQKFTSNKGPLVIGKDIPGNEEFFKGAIDDVLIYDRTLSAIEVERLYTQKSKSKSSFCSDDTPPVVKKNNPSKTVIVPIIDTVYQTVTITKIDTVMTPKSVNAPSTAMVNKHGSFVIEHLTFYRSSPDWLPSSLPALENLYNYLKSNTEIHIVLEGHTDNQGESNKNLKLSQMRVNNVKRWLSKKGIDKNRIDTIGYGDTQPLISNATEEGKRKNRRVEVKIL